MRRALVARSANSSVPKRIEILFLLIDLVASAPILRISIALAD
jgi:hypothetical protein